MTKNVFWGLDFYLGGFLFSRFFFFLSRGPCHFWEIGYTNLIFPYLGGVSVICPKYKNEGDIYKNILNI